MSHKKNDYNHYVVNSSGGLYDAKGKNPAWNGNAQVKISKNSDGWSAIINIPASDLGLKRILPGHKLAGNFVRNIGANNTDYRVWSTPENNFHQPRYFGDIKLTDKDIIVAGKAPDVGVKVKAVELNRSEKKILFNVWLANSSAKPMPVSVCVSKKTADKNASHQWLPFTAPAVKPGIWFNQLKTLPVAVQVAVTTPKGRLLWRCAPAEYKMRQPLECKVVSKWVYPGLDAGIKYEVQNDCLYSGKIMYRVMDQSGKNFLEGSVVPQKNPGFIRIPFKTLKCGNYKVCLTLNNAKGQMAGKGSVEFIKPQSPIVFKDKLPVINGKQIYPLGMYMPWPNKRDGKVIPEQSAEQILKDLNEIAASGMNTVVLSHPKWYAAQSGKTLDKATSLGLYMLCAANRDLYPQLVRKYNNIIAWVGADEPEGGKDFTPDAMRKDYLDRKKWDTSLPIFMNHMWISAVHDYLGARDIVSTDPYCFGKGFDMSKIVNFIRETQNSCGDVMPCWVILQAHKIPGHMYVPSPEQMRCQTFLALLLGADAILYYSTATPETKNWHLMTDQKSVPTWKSMKKLMGDVKEKLPMFRNKPIKCSEPGDPCENEGIFWRLGVLNGQKILTVINTQSRKVDFKLPVEAENLPKAFVPYSVNFYKVK
jgi:hypothetical protein